MTLRFAALILLLFLSGCAGLPGAQTRLIGAQPLEFVAHSSPGAGPPVVFENGLGARMEWWRNVLPGIEAEVTYFAYNRPGYGNSAAASTPRDGAHVVDELRAALMSQGLSPPYVLVGHSMGGLYMQLFARKYPMEVAALILVDSTHPRQLQGAGAMKNQSLWVRSAAKILITGTAKQELDLLTQTGDQVLALPTLSDTPVFVLSAAQVMKETTDAARFANEQRVDIARLYPGARQIWVDSGHAIPLEKPAAVVDAIRAALVEVKANR
jgi:pimeloyl-ACP methyl ester carboxylesterase